MWDPYQYARFSAHRSRPFFDLFARVEKCGPGTVVDFGCGSGELTRFFARRWPEAFVRGIDNSPDMLAIARSYTIPGRMIFEEANFLDWTPEKPVDLIFSNALLHWIPDHAVQIPRLAAMVSPRGTLALQVPNNYGARSHQQLNALLISDRWKEELGDLARVCHVRSIEWYVETLMGLEFAVDAWETRYIQILTGDRPVLEWLKGTTLRPVLDRLSEPAEQKEFLDTLGARLEEVYPAGPHGTLFPFNRILMVATRNPDCLHRKVSARPGTVPTGPI